MLRRIPERFLARVLAAAVALPTVAYGWVYLDDYLFVERGPFYASLSSLGTAFTRPVWAGKGGGYAYYRPISTALYVLAGWFSHLVSRSIEPWAFHLINLALLAAFVRLLGQLVERAGVPRLAAGAAAALFTVHPAMTGTVAWVCGQNELLLGVFVLGSVRALLEALPEEPGSAIRPRWLALHGALLLGAFLTKESALVLPALCALALGAQGAGSRRRWLVACGTWIAATVAWVLLLQLGPHQKLPLAAGEVFQSALSALPGIVIYAGRLAFPFLLSPLPTVRDTQIWTWFAGALGLLGLGVAMSTMRGKRLAWAIFGAAWFAGLLAPAFYRAGAGSDSGEFILREDRAFVAAVGLLIALAQLRLPQAWLERNRARTEIFVLSAAFALGVLGFLHALDYRSGLEFYRAGARLSPELAFAHAHLGDMELARSDYAGAVAEYRAAIGLNDRETEAHNNLGVAYLRSGDSDRAAAEFRAEIERHPDSVLGLSNLAGVFLERRDYAGAERTWTRALEIDPNYTSAWQGLVALYSATGDAAKRARAQEGLAVHKEWDLQSGI